MGSDTVTGLIQHAPRNGTGHSKTLKECLNRLDSLCTDLEAIADQLPSGTQPPAILPISQKIESIIREVHKLEEEQIFPELLQRYPDDLSLQAALERLRHEHIEDEGFSAEIAEALNDLASGSDRRTETLGYMLRGFFECLRRHIAFEREHILPKLAPTGSQAA